MGLAVRRREEIKPGPQKHRRHRHHDLQTRIRCTRSSPACRCRSRRGQQAACAAPAVYTAAQATAGQAAYAANCASCHLADLAGQNEAPQLAGTNFRSTWGKRTTSDLIEYMPATMPPGRPSLAERGLRRTSRRSSCDANGAAAGTQALTATTATSIGTIATGQAPTTRRAAAPRRAAVMATVRRVRPPVQPSRGHSVHRRGEELRAGDRCDAAQSAAPATG